MALTIIFGKNKSGKTKFLKENFNNKEDENVLFIPAESDIDSILKGNFGTAKNEDLTPNRKIINFINKMLFDTKVNFWIPDEVYEQAISFQNYFYDYFKKIENEKDDFFDQEIKNSIILNKEIAKEIIWDISLIKFHEVKLKNNLYSSGSLHYSLIKIIYEMVSHLKLKINAENKLTLVIDEVEKFLHPELIYKVGNMLYSISKKIDVVVSTHSPIFLETIFNKHKFSIKNKEEFKIRYLFFDKKIKYKEFHELNSEEITILLNKENYRFISNLSKILFSSNVFLIEGLIDNSFLNDLIYNDEELRNNYFTIIDCAGKNTIKSTYKYLSKLKILDYINLCLFYDLDNDGAIKIFKEDIQKITLIENVQNLEKRFLNYSSNQDKKIIYETKNGFLYSQSFKSEELSYVENIRNNKCFSFNEQWIFENSTKDLEYLKNEIKEIKNQLHLFFKKQM